MGIEVNYRTCTLKKEIIDSLIDIHIESAPVLIWQNIEGKRNVTKAKIEAIDFNNNSLILTAYSNADELIFDRLKVNTTFYIRGDSKNIVFKQERPAKKTNKGLLQIFIPTEVKMYEKRNDTRLQFPANRPRPKAEIYTSGRIDISTKAFHVSVRDVSISGMGFLLDKKNSRLFFEKDKIKIDKIGHYIFSRPIYGEIVYTSASHDVLDQIRVGLRFNEKLDTSILSSIAI
ncbi:MAG: hypothetical protein Q7U04_08495 [Bacteriovorax sp.]|nr:hypothetical protein [Bacteriovorax sp.]